MLKYIVYTLIGLLSICLFSCNRSENREKEMEELYVVQDERSTIIITPIRKRTLNTAITSSSDQVQKFQYTTSVTTKMGEVVDVQLQDIISSDIEFNNKLDVTTHSPSSHATYKLNSSPLMVRIIFDNDIFDNTDYYYTNGARIELVLTSAKKSPLNKVLLNLKTSDIDISGFSITQNIYTPINPEATEITYGDRPFAAFLTIGQFRESYNMKKRLQIKSALDMGVMGPISLGEQIQSTVHELEPTGWEYQIQNSFLINYYLNIEKGVYSSSNIELNLTGQANLGTLYNKLGGGLLFRAGSFMPVFRGPTTICGNRAKSQQFQYWFFVSGIAELVGYDASLQGGLLQKNSPYVLKSNEVNRTIFKGSIGLAVYYDNLGIELENFYMTPEFKGAYHFKYGRIKLVANF